MNAWTGALALTVCLVLIWVLFIPDSWTNFFGSKSPAAPPSEQASVSPSDASMYSSVSTDPAGKSDSLAPSGSQASPRTALSEQNTGSLRNASVVAHSAEGASGAPARSQTPNGNAQKSGMSLGAAAMAPLAPVRPTKTLTPEASILFTQQAGKHWVLGRCNTQGTCKAFLGVFGQGWIPYPDPSFVGNDLAAVTSPDGSHIALLTTRGGGANLWLLSPDGR
ncbi:MAG: hypothetical protein ACREKE_00825, partial [bacterium]